ncbi:Phospholipid scramblase family protein [Cyphellophora attinorum]|uniref:Phospholipid scramblase family protein n=1 Tax=Cyphellophora attinorum TaxID=1664694 RepID=A0A0N1NX99_9EURO|nr:Phospholipid scramblase family protein [Phialophora attinorum]KPI36680.1 Phospholipid scramblase family protein [Phialophora attinorum]
MPPRIPYRLAALKHPVPLTATRNLRQRASRPSKPSPPPKSEAQTGPASVATAQGSATEEGQTAPTPSISDVLAQTNDADNSLLSPVHIPEDPNAVLKSDHPSRNLLAESGIVVQRQLEMMNVFLGFEQANRYIILDPHGNHIGYMAETEGSVAKSMGRQIMRTHRPFTTNVFDRHGTEVLRFDRPFSWYKSIIKAYDPLETGSQSKVKLSTSTSIQPSTDAGPVHHLSQLSLKDMRIIGEAQMEWAPLRRKYALFLAHDLPHGAPGEPMGWTKSQQGPDMVQFAYIDERTLSWDFSLRNSSHELLASVNREFRGFGRELFTDTGSYVLRMDSAGLGQEAAEGQPDSQTSKGERAYSEALGAAGAKGMTLDQRAVMLATAVTVDFDYFSRHSGNTSGMMLPMMMGGTAPAEGAAAGGAAAEGAVIGGAGRAVGGAAGAGEGAMAGAGTLAGYEAMQRGLGRDQQDGAMADDASPQNGPPSDASYGGASGGQYVSPDQAPPEYQTPENGFGGGQGEDAWGDGNDPWKGADGSSGGSGGDGGEAASEGASGLIDSICTVM